MFDYHMHSWVSFDSKEDPNLIIKKALEMGLKEICFTDHLDYDPSPDAEDFTFNTQFYNENYDRLAAEGLKIRKGFEFGMLPDNQETMKADLARRDFDFIIGSNHFVDGIDVYYPKYWEGRTYREAELLYYEEMLRCVQNHDEFDVLGHITYIGKVMANPQMRAVSYADYKEVVDEIFRVLVAKGKGIEVNTSGMDRCGDYLPGVEHLRRFKELGGQIVTVGSDAHTADRVGQYCHEACRIVADIFGHVCTFENRKPMFHKI